MLKSFAVVLAGASICAFSAGGVYAQDTPKQKDTKVVVKDDTTAKTNKAGQDVSDASVTTAVKTRLMKDKAARGSDIDVKTNDGAVTISGAVPTAADKARIGRLVRNTTGVKSLDNKLTVSGTSTGTTGNSGDTKIVIKDDGPNLKIKDDTTPKVKKGANAVVDGSKKAANAVKGAAQKTADVTTDASVTTAVKTRLMKDDVARSTSIDVSTDDGVVTIRGAVPTAADKARIGKLVEDTTGVKTVKNELTIGG
jgi:hyperosmotically inducible periplasmic protein